jgi:hypothetical protein
VPRPDSFAGPEPPAVWTHFAALTRIARPSACQTAAGDVTDVGNALPGLTLHSKPDLSRALSSCPMQSEHLNSHVTAMPRDLPERAGSTARIPH